MRLAGLTFGFISEVCDPKLDPLDWCFIQHLTMDEQVVGTSDLATSDLPSLLDHVH